MRLRLLALIREESFKVLLVTIDCLRGYSFGFEAVDGVIMAGISVSLVRALVIIFFSASDPPFMLLS
jgi:hypothetical protein